MIAAELIQPPWMFESARERRTDCLARTDVKLSAVFQGVKRITSPLHASDCDILSIRSDGIRRLIHYGQS
ncbi:MAG: hypothetical protein AAF958_05570 [Planctomycetota bacterium]